MSYQPPLQPGPGPGQDPGPFAPYGQSQQGAPPPYGMHPAYAGMPSPAPRSGGLNPWVAGFIGVLIGGVGAMALSFLLPMIFFGLLLGGPMGDEGFVDGPMTSPSQVTVAADGSVAGTVLAEALMESGWYEGLSCPNTAKVATDVTALCESNGGFMDSRLVVVFRGDAGRFSVAEILE